MKVSVKWTRDFNMDERKAIGYALGVDRPATNLEITKFFLGHFTAGHEDHMNRLLRDYWRSQMEAIERMLGDDKDKQEV